MGWYNVGSLFLGLVALILPSAGILLSKRTQQSHGVMSTVSMAACAIAIYLQMVYHQHLINISDMSALLDTHQGVTMVAGTLLAVTLVLNAVNLIIHRKTK